jgi:glyoxylase-like metal-dependent hydrolase (beta-lactamase superfamily II)
MELKQVARDVYACLQPDRGWGWSNSGLVNRAGGLVVDTLMDVKHTRQALELYARVAPQPARRLVNTHDNADHVWGNQLFRQSEIIGHRNCAEAMRTGFSPAVMSAMVAAKSPSPGVKWFADDVREFDFSEVEVTPPTTLIDQRLDLDLDGERCEIVYLGPAHTSSDTVVWLPGERVLFTGDLLFRLCTPLGWEGTFAGWIRALDWMIAREPAVVVPGHGPLCGVEGLREMRAYLVYVRAESERLHAQGLSELDAARRIELGPYASWTQPERLVFNVARAYREIRGDPPHAAVNAAALLDQCCELRRTWNERGRA